MIISSLSFSLTSIKPNTKPHRFISHVSVLAFCWSWLSIFGKITSLYSLVFFLLTFPFQQFLLKMNLIALLCNIIASALAILLKAHLFLSCVKCHTLDDPWVCMFTRDGNTGERESLSSTLASLGILGRPLL